MYHRPAPADCTSTACKHCSSVGASCAQRIARLALGTTTLRVPVPATSRACPCGTRAVPGFAVFREVRCSSGPSSGSSAPPEAAGCAEVARLASLSRVFIGVQPARHLARNLGRVARPNGPLSVLIVIFTVLGALLAALWRRIVSNVRECSACRGFGIARCRLCTGMGSVGWEGKFRHNEPCPVCLGRRYTECQHCGGRFHRPLFHHARRDPVAFAESLQESYSPVGARVLED